MGKGIKRAKRAAAMTRTTGISVTLERLGKTQRWEVSAKPFADKPRLRSAYTRGFYARTADWNMGVMRLADGPPVYHAADEQSAYDQGYAVAQAQEAK